MSSPSERIINLYQRYAVDWDRERGRSLFEKDWLDRFLALLPQKSFHSRHWVWLCRANCPLLDREGLRCDWHRLFVTPHRHVQGPFS